MQFITLDHLHRRAQPLFHAVSKRLSRVASIDQHTFNSKQIAFASIGRSPHAVAVGHIGRGDGDGVRQSLRIDGNVSLDAGDFFACIVALLLGASTIKKLVMQLRPCLIRAAPT
jgi:hypothetical protein